MEVCMVPTAYLDKFCVGCWYESQCSCDLKMTNSDGRFVGKPKKQKKTVQQEVVPEPVIEVVPEPVQIEVKEPKKKKVLRKLSFDIDI